MKELVIILKEQETTRETEAYNVMIGSDVCKILNNKLLNSAHPQHTNEYILWDRQDNLPVVMYVSKNLKLLWNAFNKNSVPVIVRFDRDMDVKVIAVFYEKDLIDKIISEVL